MAEAHAAVAFSFVVTQEGLDFNVNKEVLKAVWRSGIRSWKKRLARFKNSMHNRVFPAPPSSWLIVVALVFAASLAGWDVSRYGVASLEYVSQEWFGIVEYYHLTACLMFSMILWLTGVLFMRYMLLFLFSYMAWMYEPRGKMSLRSKIWLGVVKLFKGRNPRLYSYQSSLPKLPVPSLDDTIQRYIRSVRPFTNDEEYNKIQILADEFKDKLGNRLQFYLKLKSWWATNYVSDWWEEYVYLAGRSSIMVNSNFYGIDTIRRPFVGTQTSRAANFVFIALQHRRQIDREEVKPILINNTVPICSGQYERQFNTTRIPREEKDYLQHLQDSQHIAVLYRGRYFKVYFHFNGHHLHPVEMEQQFQQILDDKSPPYEGEEHLAALTAGERVPWARARQRFFTRGMNKTSLDAIEKAAFMLVFEEEEHFYDPEDHTRLDAFGRSMLHGKGHDRWFDKSFTLVVCKNGRIGFNAEHSWADAPIMAHLWEVCIGRDYLTTINSDGICGYTPEGNCVGKPRGQVPNPIRLKWEIPAECQETIEQSLSTAQTILEDVELHILVHKAFGKGLMKKCRISPDAFIQMALQLAYFRDSDKHCLTYEASMTRMFREGRTETVRSCTIESSHFVQKMCDKNTTKEERLAALKTAADRHQLMYRDAMSGQGIDRHLFCLYVVSKYLGVDSPFLQKVLSEPWRLSTSQTPHQQTDLVNQEVHSEMITAGGGFGPVADDGYGVSYIIAGEDTMFFHISCKRSCPTTNSFRFGQAIATALKDLLDLFSKSSTVEKSE